MAHIPFPASSPQLSSFGLFQDRDVLVHHPLPLPAPASKCRALSRCSMNVCEFVNARTQLLGGRGGEENATPALRGHGARMMGASALLGPQPHSGQSRACHGLPSPPTGHSEHAETPPPIPARPGTLPTGAFRSGTSVVLVEPFMACTAAEILPALLLLPLFLLPFVSPSTSTQPPCLSSLPSPAPTPRKSQGRLIPSRRLHLGRPG